MYFTSKESPIGCTTNIIFKDEEMCVFIAFGHDPTVNDDYHSFWYKRDKNVFIYLDEKETALVEKAFNDGSQGLTINEELEILFDDEFTYIYISDQY